MFYENKKNKIEVIKAINEQLNIQFHTSDNILINLDKFVIENKDYKMEINGKMYPINFNNFYMDYLYQDMLNIKDKKYENCLNNITNYSLQGYLLNNRCFNNENLFNEFQLDINDILNNSTLEEVFDSIKPFKNFNYPFCDKAFRDQLNVVII